MEQKAQITDRKTQIEERLKAYYKAELAVLENQSYTIGTRSFTKANLGEIQRVIKQLENKLTEMSSPKRRMARIIPRDL